jgi:hypothetical protein
VRHRRQRPHPDRQRISRLGPQLVDQPPDKQERNPIRNLEHDQDISEIVIEHRLMELVRRRIPTHERHTMQQRLDKREHPAVHVIDGGRQK